METKVPKPGTEAPGTRSKRVHYLDWLRVLAILGVFLFHAVHAFDATDWHIKNAETSIVVTLVFVVFLYPWGMPLFFLLSGAGSWFALQRRTVRQFAGERLVRLFIPFIVGALLLTPFQAYLEWRHKLQAGLVDGSYLAFFVDRGIGFRPGFSPMIFGWLGYHMWFLGFLFAYALIALPIFQWLKGGGGRRFVGWLASLCDKRGGLLIFLLPIVLFQLVLRPVFLAEHDWADFIYTLLFFISGYIFYMDPRFIRAVKRDWPIALTVGVLSTLFFLATAATGVAMDWATTPGTLEFYILWSVFSINSWCWCLFVLYIGMRYLDYSNAWLRYGQEMIMPFFVFHQPVILLIAFFVVQWEVATAVKILVVVGGSFIVSLGIFELIIKRIKITRRLFGMKASRPGSPA